MEEEKNWITNKKCKTNDSHSAIILQHFPIGFKRARAGLLCKARVFTSIYFCTVLCILEEKEMCIYLFYSTMVWPQYCANANGKQRIDCGHRALLYSCTDQIFGIAGLVTDCNGLLTRGLQLVSGEVFKRVLLHICYSQGISMLMPEIWTPRCYVLDIQPCAVI